MHGHLKSDRDGLRSVRLHLPSPESRTFKVPAPAWPVVAASIAAILTYVAVAIARMGYPFELEWIEGGSLTMVRRVIEGRPLYAAPSLEYVPFNYPPLYYWVSSVLVRLLGEGFAALRLVSFAASLASGALLFALVSGTTRSRTAAWLSAGLFFATFRLAGAWFDVARIDSLHLALVLAAMAVLLFDRSPRRAPLIAAALIVLGFLAKQSAIIAVMPAAVYLLATDRPRGLWFTGALIAGIGVAVGLLDRASDGWFRYYVFELAGRYSMEFGLAGRFWVEDFIKPLSVCIFGGIWALVFPPEPGSRRGLGLALILGLVLASWSVRAYPATYDNVLMPACAAAAWLLGLGWNAVQYRAERMAAPAGPRLAWLAAATVLVQFSLLLYDPFEQVPSASDRAAGHALLENVTQAEGAVLIPCHSYLTTRAGKGEHFHEMSYMAVAKSGDDTTAIRLRGQLRDALAEQRWGWVILDTRDWLYEMVDATYEARFDPFRTDAEFWPVTGMRRRPEAVFVPRDSLRNAVLPAAPPAAPGAIPGI
jgi:4-amino-4-deoxy-L-arabinose transferase-like glycosyltransferase